VFHKGVISDHYVLFGWYNIFEDTLSCRVCLYALVICAGSGKRYKRSALRIFFRIINDFAHRCILDCTFIDFTFSLLILPFHIVEFNSKMVKSTVKP
jgi:hypothetical protein